MLPLKMDERLLSLSLSLSLYFLFTLLCNTVCYRPRLEIDFFSPAAPTSIVVAEILKEILNRQRVTLLVVINLEFHSTSRI